MDSCWLHFMMLTWVCLFVCMKDREIIMLCMLFVQTWLCYFLSVYFMLIHKAEERAVSSLSSLKTALHSSLFYSSSLWNIVLSFLCLSILRSALIFIWNFENRKTWFSLTKITLLICHFLSFLCDAGHMSWSLCLLCVLSWNCPWSWKGSGRKKIKRRVCFYDKTGKLCCFFSGSTCVTKCRGWDEIHWIDGDQWPFNGKLLTM